MAKYTEEELIARRAARKVQRAAAKAREEAEWQRYLLSGEPQRIRRILMLACQEIGMPYRA